ncbi:hypothetical protein [Thermus thermamylovorans]|uniref:Uncharacterized protein n=1 Tax=Thermus thermamylovorans TaxID=2509362 RepID=A0A4Q9B5Y2_9DEIN|nr:hypothetical protein [Thermus thermamylovorans]TBH21459.1 hypothetical protein ETP66_02295 [Thermus thermamylovorans]
MEEEREAIYARLAEYVERFVPTPGRMRRLEDNLACHLFVWTKGELRRPVTCFDEAAGPLERLLGGRRVFCYDEWEGLRLAVTQVYRFGRLRLLVLTAFKKGARVAWPPRKA